MMQEPFAEVNDHRPARHLPAEPRTHTGHVRGPRLQSLARAEELPFDVERNGMATDLPNHVQNTESRKRPLLKS